jgi:hypothetical protein
MAAVPFFAESKIELSAKGNYSHQQGSSSSEETTIESTCEANVPANSRGEVIITAKRVKISVPFKYTERITYTDDKVERILRTGTYHGVESYDIDVKLKTEKICEQTFDETMNGSQQKLEERKINLLQSQIQIPPKGNN